MSEPLPELIPAGTPFCVRWPTGKIGLRETYMDLRLCRSPEELPEWARGGPHRPGPPPLPVYCYMGAYSSCVQWVKPADVIWDPVEAARAKEKLRIFDEVY